MGTIPAHLSYSHLHLLVCPYAAWLKYEHAMRSPSTPWLVRGTAIHTALERAHEVSPFSLQIAVTTFKSDYRRIIEEDEVFVGYPQMVKLEKEGVEMLERYWGQIENGTIKDNPLALEAEFSLPIAGTKLVGKIDKIEIDESDGQYIVTDYKSGSKKPDEFDLRNNLQLTAYYWAVFELYGKYPKQVIWHHLKTGELLKSERTPQDIENLKVMISNAVAMKKQDIRHRIFHEGVCNHCDFKGAVCMDYGLEQELLAKG